MQSLKIALVKKISKKEIIHITINVYYTINI